MSQVFFNCIYMYVHLSCIMGKIFFPRCELLVLFSQNTKPFIGVMNILSEKSHLFDVYLNISLIW